MVVRTTQIYTQRFEIDLSKINDKTPNNKPELPAPQVVKSRLQALPSPASLAALGRPAAPAYSGTLDAVLKILRQEGLGGFFKGIRVKIVQSVLAAALLFMVKEEISAAVRAFLKIPQAV